MNLSCRPNTELERKDKNELTVCFSVCFVIFHFIGVIPIVLCCYSLLPSRTENFLANSITIAKVLENWNAVPFVQLSVHDDQCPDDMEIAFKKVWRGTSKGFWMADGDCSKTCGIKKYEEGEGYVRASWEFISFT